MKNDFEKWFQNYGITDHHLFNSLDAWQISMIKQIAKRAYIRGKKTTLQDTVIEKIKNK